MVQLKVQTLVRQNTLTFKFQFLYGTIKSRFFGGKKQLIFSNIPFQK